MQLLYIVYILSTTKNLVSEDFFALVFLCDCCVFEQMIILAH